MSSQEPDARIYTATEAPTVSAGSVETRLMLRVEAHAGQALRELQDGETELGVKSLRRAYETGRALSKLRAGVARRARQ